jgi:ComEC/Rec2-related protein
LITWLIRKFLGFYAGIIVSGLVVSIYAIIGGMEPATMRALVIVLLVFAAILSRREASLSRILLIGGALLVSFNPLLLLDDPSFQLSVLAVLGLIFLGPIIERGMLIRGIPYTWTSYLAPICAAQLGVLPYIVYSSQSIALYALLSNMLVLFFIGVLSIGGIIIVAVGWLVPTLFPLAAFPVSLALSAVLAIAHSVQGLPYALIPIHVSGWVVSIVYTLLVIWIFRRHHDGSLTPLALFTLRSEVNQLAKRKIPWAPPIPDSQGIQFNYNAFAFAPGPRRGQREEEQTINWDD